MWPLIASNIVRMTTADAPGGPNAGRWSRAEVQRISVSLRLCGEIGQRDDRPCMSCAVLPSRFGKGATGLGRRRAPSASAPRMRHGMPCPYNIPSPPVGGAQANGRCGKLGGHTGPPLHCGAAVGTTSAGACNPSPSRTPPAPARGAPTAGRGTAGRPARSSCGHWPCVGFSVSCGQLRGFARMYPRRARSSRSLRTMRSW